MDFAAHTGDSAAGSRPSGTFVLPYPFPPARSVAADNEEPSEVPSHVPSQVLAQTPPGYSAHNSNHNTNPNPNANPNSPGYSELRLPGESFRASSWGLVVRELHPMALLVRRRVVAAVAAPAAAAQEGSWTGSGRGIFLDGFLAPDPTAGDGAGAGERTNKNTEAYKADGVLDLEYRWVPLSQLGGALDPPDPAERVGRGGGTDSDGRGPERHLCLSLTMYESTLDIDPLQVRV